MTAALGAEQWSEAAEAAKLAEEDLHWRRRLRDMNRSRRRETEDEEEGEGGSGAAM